MVRAPGPFPGCGRFNLFALVIGLGAFAAIQWAKVDIMLVVAGAALAGLTWHLV